MKKFLALFFILSVSVSSAAFAELPPILESTAFAHYKTRIKTELSKLIYLLDRFNDPDMEIKIDGNTYTSAMAFPFAKAFLAIYYRKEKAEVWIQKYCYRSPFTNQVMLGCLKGQKCVAGRDLLLGELEELRKAEQIINAPKKQA